MQGTFVNLCYTMENHAIATMMTYFGSTDHGLGTEVDRGWGSTSSKNGLESPLVYIISSDLQHIFLTHVEMHISEPFFMLLDPGPSSPGCHPRRRVLSTLLTAFLLTDRLTLWLKLKNFRLIYFLDIHSFFLLAQFPWFISTIPYLP